MSGSYLDRTDEEQEALSATQAEPKAAGFDLSGVAPKAAPRPSPDLQEAAVREGRRRGFDRSTSSTPLAADTPRVRAPRKSPRGGGEGAKRVIVALGTVVHPGQIGQVAISGDAALLREFVNRAHWERKTRGELLADMLAFWEAHHGPLPPGYMP